jgi:hypothetical protein
MRERRPPGSPPRLRRNRTVTGERLALASLGRMKAAAEAELDPSVACHRGVT